MKWVKLNSQNHSEVVAVAKKCQQIVPFFMSDSQARTELMRALDSLDDHVFGMDKNGQLLAVVSCRQKAEEVSITSALFDKKKLKKSVSVHACLTQLEKLVKLGRASELVMCVKLVDYAVIQQLLAREYDLTEQTATQAVFKKTLNYRTALVLAGGGARGAYQIGAWRALEELAIDCQLITGTSVGALNGGLILQGDLQAAEAMWNEIDTGKILSFPMSATTTGFSMKQMMKEIQELALSAILNQGVSTEPLKTLITDVLDEPAIRQSQRELIICTTQLPHLKEVVVALTETPVGEFGQWLLASSSFFPAMAATQIGNEYYIDGGYRNNIPVDIAAERGATELIIIDVKGPGITKPVKLSTELPVTTVVSPWSLGTVLLFDGNRSKWNRQLGYLETLKAFGRHVGYWYTFDLQMTDVTLQQWHNQLFRTVFQQFTEEEKSFFRNPMIIKELLKKIRKLYNDRVTVATISFYVLECVGKVLAVSPVRLYTIASMKKAIRKALADDRFGAQQKNDKMLLSLQEWLKLYADDLPLPTEKRQVLYLYQALEDHPHDPLLLRAARIVPDLYLVAHVLRWFETDGREE